MSANTPALVWLPLKEPPRKGSVDLPPKGLMCHGSRPELPGLLAASMSILFFADLLIGMETGPFCLSALARSP